MSIPQNAVLLLRCFRNCFQIHIFKSKAGQKTITTNPLALLVSLERFLIMAVHYFEESWLNCSDRFVKKDISLKKLSEIKDLDTK